MTNEEKILDILVEMSLRMDSMNTNLATKDDIDKVHIQIETGIIPKQVALAEGIAAILEQLVPVTRVDELESRVKFLETMLRSMADELQQLKQAQ